MSIEEKCMAVGHKTTQTHLQYRLSPSCTCKSAELKRHAFQSLPQSDPTQPLLTFKVAHITLAFKTRSQTHTKNWQSKSVAKPNLLTPWSRVLLEKLTGFAASQEIPRIFGTRRFITVLQVPATCPYPEPTPSGPPNPRPLPEDPS